MSFNSLTRSGNSADTSKRSRGNSAASNSSNNSQSSGDGGQRSKKKKVNQKTLGVAWGANSRSSSRSSFRSSPFSDFGSYMVVKNRKLQDQFEAEAASSSHGGSNTLKPIFHGVSIFVDGFTIPSSQELRGYMLKYGGRFENYFSRHHVTHIICSNLPDSKVKNLRSFSGGLPVVKPQWIMDSVAANKLLSWVPYELNQVANNQPKLSSFFALKNALVSKDALGNQTSNVDDIAESSLDCGILKEEKFIKEVETIEERMQSDERFEDESNERFEDESRDDVIKNVSVNCCAEPLVSCGTEPTVTKAEQKTIFGEELQESPDDPCTSASSHHVNSTNMRESSNLAFRRQSPKSHSTLGDPNFVENYFKFSRLHFIGTWRNRYRKRYPSTPDGVMSTSSKDKASEDPEKTFVIHIDMDCFFVSVVIRDLPELQDKPVAICHSDNPKGTAEISSANYPARDYGVKAGMFVKNAKALCPHLAILPYNFEAYEEVADQFYDILHKRCKKVQAVSCDEAFLDVTDSEVDDPELLATEIRKEIYETTRCTASAGIAGNMLMARLATRTAKPNGQCYISFERVDDYLHDLPIKALPGIGHVLEDKLKQRNIRTCGQLRMISKESLQRDFGVKTGEMLWNYSRGADNRVVGTIQESKSIGAEVNWGVRFRDLKDSKQFLSNLCKEVSLRLQGYGVQGRKFTLKIKKRRKDAEEPAKYMGCGDCENFSHTVTVPVATDDVDVLHRITTQLFGSFHVDVKEIRGVGLQVSKLSADATKQVNERNLLKTWLTSRRESNINSDPKERTHIVLSGLQGRTSDGSSIQLTGDSAANLIETNWCPAISEAHSNQSLEPPPLCHLDLGVIESLPPEILSELNEAYGGKLATLISESYGKSEEIGNDETGQCSTAEGSLSSDVGPSNKVQTYNEMEQPQLPIEGNVPMAVPSSSNLESSRPSIGNTDFMPSSLSQVDPLVLQQLPKELIDGIVQLLPAHRECDISAADLTLCKNMPEDQIVMRSTENLDSVVMDGGLWIGNPPNWIAEFGASKSSILNMLADLYIRSGPTGNLSVVLQHCISEVSEYTDSEFDGVDDTIHCLSELLKQYIKQKIESDIEEIYICCRIFKRLSAKSKLFQQVYDVIYPYLQASVNENYGGNLHVD
ncbi:DNA repair protein REV1 isoform X1 [Punica granatum]|uniref:DNA repair protein REV1 n=1 Tax=Punica granatum TaxID=22663 RepID=A0A6P8CFX5_PUNGR|nr:DNA repair protein REV1 isoform X1 [Punica granatum]XP_031381990.1 DNA repair protein REV1 isoform X1 [Punica granatum]